MVTGGFPAVARSLHQATGILIWVTTFAMTYLARIAAGRSVIAAQRATDDTVGVDTRATIHGAARA